MNILCIETSTQVCSAALVCDGELVASRLNRSGSNHAKLLPIYVQDLLAESKEKGLQLDAVALSDGPGSYTGLRIGAATAKGLCYGLSIPLIPIHTTEVLCASFLAQNPITEGYLFPMIDARRMEVYTAKYSTRIEETTIQAMVIDKNIPLPPHSYIFGDGAAKCQSILCSESVTYVPDIVPDAKYMGRLAEQKMAERHIQGVDLAYFEPYYLKQFVAAQAHVKGLQ